ncbi:5,6-dimethylbenzimidazole synthase, partial [Nocardiopsis sp. MG754419]|nr:5,6-dimethylbenzimidazole synthase [Nocardiopsis sp. MG754419]
MTNDDREDARHGDDEPHERRGRPSPGLGPLLGGLLDGLPESGKGAQGTSGAQEWEPRSAPGNPFRRPGREPMTSAPQVRPMRPAPEEPPAPPAPPSPEQPG